MTSYRVAWAGPEHAPRLQEFFRRAYGETSILTNLRFLRWLLGAGDGGFNSVVAISGSGEIAAHYGAVVMPMLIHARPVRAWWGISAYTLPEHRGRGLGQELLPPFLDRSEVFGVIGFTPKTADFYDRLGFNLFGRRRFVRFARVLDESCYGLASLYGKETADLQHRLPVTRLDPHRTAAGSSEEALEVASGEVLPSGSFSNADCGDYAATWRTPDYIRWRYLEAPAPKYRLLIAPGARAFIAYRIRRLMPTNMHAMSIIDICGSPEAVEPLLRDALARADGTGCVFADFAAAGGGYGPTLRASGFEALHDADAELLPMLTSPVAPRANHEYVGLYSRESPSLVSQLTFDRLYLTRGDSDRDRAARLSDLEESA
jgi:GNAT superfamily N-acetyltransferase